MKIVAFEGLDASGKATQTDLLARDLFNAGHKVLVESFPRYNQPIGQLIRSWLDKDIELTDEAVHMLYEADRQDFQAEIARAEKAGYDYLVIDRYVLSNLAFGMAKGIDQNWLQDLQGLIQQPDITFVLDVSSRTSFQRRPEGRDRHEIDSSLLNRTRAAYDFLANSIPEYTDRLIYSINANGTPEEVHDAIMELHKADFF